MNTSYFVFYFSNQISVFIFISFRVASMEPLYAINIIWSQAAVTAAFAAHTNEDPQVWDSI